MDSNSRTNQPAERQRIVLVEDNEDSRAMLARLLQLSGYSVQVACDGIEAVELIQRERPDVAVVDIGLPGLDGYEVAQHVRSALPQGEVRLIALTGYGQPEDRRRALDAGFDAHMVKPVNLQELLRALDAK